MSALDLSKLSGPDAIAALRSYPRRFRTALAPLPDDPDIDELAHRIGPSGTAAIDHVVTTSHTFAVLGRALEEVSIHDDPALHPAIIDGARREWPTPPELTLAAALGDLETEAGQLVAVADRIHGPDWNRSGHVADGPAVTALGIVHEAVRTGSDQLRAAEADIAAARR
jgi:hypothetical protein